MTSQPPNKNILDYVGDDGEFLYSIDNYLYETYEDAELYEDWYPENDGEFYNTVGFPADYLEWLENYHEVFDPQPLDAETPFIIGLFIAFGILMLLSQLV